MGFATALGAPPAAPRWNLEPRAGDHDYARQLIADGTRTLVISACSSHSARNWSAAGYAAVADHAANVHGLRVILAGGPSPVEQEMAAQITALARVPLVNQVGRDTLPQLLALLSRATALLTPDSGPEENWCRPSADPLLRSVAELGPEAAAVILSGMGHDGLEGCRCLHAAGGRILVQDEATSVVWGMPGAVAAAGLADAVAPVARLAELLMCPPPGGCP